MTMADCGWLQRRRAEQAIAAAFRQAFEESGLPDHPGGECPSPDCRCAELADAIADRAEELAAAKLGIPVEELRDADG
jgi:hypothetical protein